jgi:hypothetical protein
MQRLNSPGGISSAQWSYISKLRNDILKFDSNYMTSVTGDRGTNDIIAQSEKEE